jgi:hypothetical protein
MKGFAHECVYAALVGLQHEGIELKALGWRVCEVEEHDFAGAFAVRAH